MTTPLQSYADRFATLNTDRSNPWDEATRGTSSLCPISTCAAKALGIYCLAKVVNIFDRDAEIQQDGV